MLTNILLYVVHRIYEESRKHPAFDIISTLDNMAMLVCFHETGVEEKEPNGLKELTPHERKNSSRWGNVKRFHVPILKVIGQL